MFLLFDPKLPKVVRLRYADRNSDGTQMGEFKDEKRYRFGAIGNGNFKFGHL